MVIRPSYVLGGRAMEIIYDRDAQLHRYIATKPSSVSGDHPVLIDEFSAKTP